MSELRRDRALDGRTVSGSTGGGPLRFNACRNDNSFYREDDVGYLRAVELLMPQCISPFYLGSGATVGFHAITCLCTISRLMRRREAGEIDFHVWPQEGRRPRRGLHAIAECYPAMYPVNPLEDVNQHERDALRTVDWMRSRNLENAFETRRISFGRRIDIGWEEQLNFEGWVLGV